MKVDKLLNSPNIEDVILGLELLESEKKLKSTIYLPNMQVLQSKTVYIGRKHCYINSTFKQITIYHYD